MQQDGRLRADVDAERLTSVMLAVSDGMQIQWLYDPSRDMAEHVELVAQLAITQAAPRPLTRRCDPPEGCAAGTGTASAWSRPAPARQDGTGPTRPSDDDVE